MYSLSLEATRKIVNSPKWVTTPLYHFDKWTEKRQIEIFIQGTVLEIGTEKQAAQLPFTRKLVTLRRRISLTFAQF
jgi:hypothetical protein